MFRLQCTPWELYITIINVVLFVCSVHVGMRDQPLDWKTAPPVHVLSFLVLGSEKDAQSKDVSGCSPLILIDDLYQF